MILTREQRDGLDVALDEADLLGVEVDAQRRIAAITFRVLTLPEQGPAPQDRRVQVLLAPVGRVAASLRAGAFHDRDAAVLPLTLDGLLATVQSFGGVPVYGRQFLDVHTDELSRWGDRLSLDWSSGDDGRTHSLTLFQEHAERHLDLCLWFDTLEIRDARGQPVPLEAFVAGGKRWWQAFRAGDPRTDGHGMFPL